MITLSDISKTFDHTWDSVSSGWNHLVSRASNALTRFHAGEDDEEKVLKSMAGITRWGLLSADIYDDDDKVVVAIEAPGMEEKDFDISIVDNILYIRGEKHFSKEENKNGYTVKERAFGRFERALPLGYEVDPDNAKASYKQGVLHIEVNKAEQHKRRQIKVS